MLVTGAASFLFPALRRADALTAESLMESKLEESIAEPVD
jgi:hypothetical protein